MTCGKKATSGAYISQKVSSQNFFLFCMAQWTGPLCHVIRRRTQLMPPHLSSHRLISLMNETKRYYSRCIRDLAQTNVLIL